MGDRRSSRELAMQALFFADMKESDSKEVIELFCTNFEPSETIRPFFLELVDGVIAHKE